MPKSASFDVIGTCFDFDEVIATIQTRLAALLAAAKVEPKSLFFSWFYAAQRDFTYASLAGAYSPIATVLQHTFKRACYTVDMPRDAVSDNDVAAVMAAFKAMGPRPGLKAAFDGLRDAGWDVYAVTNGGVQTSLGYYHAAGIELDEGHLLSCDAIKIAKPDLRVYENAHRHLTERGVGTKGTEGDGKGDRWFVAAHAWDLMAARAAGFRTAFLRFEEHDSVKEVFGEFDLEAESMEELLEALKKV